MDRSLRDVIRFLDPSGDITDADIAGLSKKLKFTDVLDVITSVSNDDIPKAREILTHYDNRFSIAKEYVQPTAKIGGGVRKPGGFKPIKPVGTSPTTTGSTTAPTNPNGTDTDDQQEQDVNALITDPATKNKPEVQQIAKLLQRMNR